MSQENVELFHRMNAARNRGDAEDFVRHSNEDVVIIAARSAVEGPFAGHEGVRKFFSENTASFEAFQRDYDDVRDLGDDRVLAIGTIHLRDRGGGVGIDIPAARVATFRDGKLSRWDFFREHRAALKAVGLEE